MGAAWLLLLQRRARGTSSVGHPAVNRREPLQAASLRSSSMGITDLVPLFFWQYDYYLMWMHASLGW